MGTDLCCVPATAPSLRLIPDRPLSETSKGVVTCAPQNVPGPQGRAAPACAEQTPDEVDVKTRIASHRPISTPGLHVTSAPVTSKGSQSDQAQRSRPKLYSSFKQTCAKGKATSLASSGPSDDSMLFRFPVATASTAQLRAAHPATRSRLPDQRSVHNDIPSNLPQTCEARVRNHSSLLSKETSAELLRLVDESLAHPTDLAGWSSLAAFADFNLETSPQVRPRPNSITAFLHVTGVQFRYRILSVYSILAGWPRRV